MGPHYSQPMEPHGASVMSQLPIPRGCTDWCQLRATLGEHLPSQGCIWHRSDSPVPQHMALPPPPPSHRCSHLAWSCPRRVPVRSGGSRGDDGSTPTLQSPPRPVPPGWSLLWAGAVVGRGMLSSGGTRGVLPAQGHSSDGRARGGSGAASHGEGKVNSCRAVIMRRVGVAGQLRPCPSPTGTICDQAQLCLPYQPFRSDFPTTSPSRRPHFLTARGWRGTAGLARHGTAVLVLLGARQGTAWLSICSLAQTPG